MGKAAEQRAWPFWASVVFATGQPALRTDPSARGAGRHRRTGELCRRREFGGYDCRIDRAGRAALSLAQ